MPKEISKVWSFTSDSNPNVIYETLLMVDGTTSCNCKGWTRRVDANGIRSCKHTRYIDQGLADKHCSTMFSYSDQGMAARKANSPAAKRAEREVVSVKGKRRIRLEAT